MVGTSAGSYVAAYVRAGIRPADLMAVATRQPVSAEAAGLVRRLGASEELAPAPTRPPPRPLAAGVVAAAIRSRRLPRAGALLAALLPAGTVDAEPFLAPLRELWGGMPWPEGMRLCAVRARDGARVVFDGSSAASRDTGGARIGVDLAVGASSAVPGVMEPIVFGGETYVDGTVHSPTNADLMLGAGVDTVVVSAPMATPTAGGAGFGRDGTVRRWASFHLAREVARLGRAGLSVVVLVPDAASCATLARRDGTVSERRGAAAEEGYRQIRAGAAAVAAALA